MPGRLTAGVTTITFRVDDAVGAYRDRGFEVAAAIAMGMTSLAALATGLELWRSGEIAWLGAVLANALGFAVAAAWWRVARTRGVSRTFATTTLLIMTVIPNVSLAICSLLDPQIPAAFTHSALIWWYPLLIGSAGLYLDPRVTRVVSISAGINFFALFAFSRSALLTLEGSPTIVGMLSSWNSGAFIALAILALGFVTGRIGTVTRNIVVRLMEEEEEKRAFAEQEAEQEQLRTAAEHASEAKSAFLSSMSHELRTPLNAIMGYTQLLRRTADLEPDVRESLEVMQTSGDHLLDLINDVLDLARIEAGRLEFQSEVVDMAALVGSVADLMTASATAKGLTLITRVETGTGGVVVADELRTRQVLINLVGNAIKFSTTGTVSLIVKPTGQSTSHGVPLWRFEVRDTGPGIPASSLQDIFEPFERANARETEAPGTGLGLSISRRLVAGMGGTLSVRSVLGQGSVFFFELALVPSLESVESGPHEAIIRGYVGDRREILIVDDRETNRVLLQTLLTSLGFDVVLANSGQQALDTVDRSPPDLVLMDIAMPGMTGKQASQLLRVQPATRDLPIIAVSASPLAATETAGLFDASVRKPVDIEELLHAIGRTLALTWTRRGRSERPEEVAWQAPSIDVLRRLHQLATLGNLVRLRDELSTLRTESPHLSAFLEEIDKHAKAYDDRRVLALLEEAMDLHSGSPRRQP